MEGTYNQHIGIFKTQEDFDSNQHLLVAPWVAYIGDKVVYSNDIKVKDNQGVNVFDAIQKLFPVCCTEEEYDNLVSNGHGTVTDTNGVQTDIMYDPNVYYYTYDPSELNNN